VIWQPFVPTQPPILNQAIGEQQPIHSFGSRSADVSAVFDALWIRVRRLAR
jgi:hypothetical protein